MLNPEHDLHKFVGAPGQRSRWTINQQSHPNTFPEASIPFTLFDMLDSTHDVGVPDTFYVEAVGRRFTAVFGFLSTVLEQLFHTLTARFDLLCLYSSLDYVEGSCQQTSNASGDSSTHEVPEDWVISFPWLYHSFEVLVADYNRAGKWNVH